MRQFTGHIRPRADHLQVRHFGGPRTFREAGLGDLRIAHLTDQHVGRVTPACLQRAAIDAANNVDVDLVLLTGDYVAYSLDHLSELRDYLSHLKAPAYAVLGNHDHWKDAKAVSDTLGEAGVQLMTNAWTDLNVRGSRLQLVGLDDMYTNNHDFDSATLGLDPTVPTIAMSHVGEAADELWERGVDLVLSGHTHSGQFSVAGLGERFLTRFGGHRYVHGLYGCREGHRHPGTLYVSAGIGSSRLSVRFGERALPEVALFNFNGRTPRADEHHVERAPHG